MKKMSFDRVAMSSDDLPITHINPSQDPGKSGKSMPRKGEESIELQLLLLLCYL